MVKAMLVVVLLGLVAIQSVYSDDLKCYICNDCESVADEETKSCTGTIATLPPTLLPSATTKPPATNKPPVTTVPPTTTVAPTKVPTLKYRCYKLTVTAGGKTVTNRGCILSKCDVLTANLKEAECVDCETDGCNPADNIKSWTLSSVILVAIIKMFV